MVEIKRNVDEDRGNDIKYRESLKEEEEVKLKKVEKIDMKERVIYGGQRYKNEKNKKKIGDYVKEDFVEIYQIEKKQKLKLQVENILEKD